MTVLSKILDRKKVLEVAIVSFNFFLVRKYQRILPRPTEAYGQPLSIITTKEGAGSGMTAFKFKLISGAQGEWCRPTQPSMAVYNEPETNVFLQLQNEPIPVNF